MKNKNFIFMILAIICSLLLALPMFMTMFTYQVNGEIVSEFGLFADYSDIVSIFDAAGSNFQSFWATLTMIFAIAALAAGVVYIIATILGLINGKKLWTNIKKFASIGLLICFIVLLLSTMMFTLLNTFTQNIIIEEIVHGMCMEVAGWIMLPACLFAGLFGWLSCGKIKSGKRKKR